MVGHAQPVPEVVSGDLDGGFADRVGDLGDGVRSRFDDQHPGVRARGSQFEGEGEGRDAPPTMLTSWSVPADPDPAADRRLLILRASASEPRN